MTRARIGARNARGAAAASRTGGRRDPEHLARRQARWIVEQLAELGEAKLDQAHEPPAPAEHGSGGLAGLGVASERGLSTSKPSSSRYAAPASRTARRESDWAS
jgi:hypothetical protein